MYDLASIDGHRTYFFCPCGHCSAVAVRDLLARGETDLHAVVNRLRCTACGKRGDMQVRIVHDGKPTESRAS
jgi:hypothetical protein